MELKIAKLEANVLQQNNIINKYNRLEAQLEDFIIQQKNINLQQAKIAKAQQLETTRIEAEANAQEAAAKKAAALEAARLKAAKDAEILRLAEEKTQKVAAEQARILKEERENKKQSKAHVYLRKNVKKRD